MPLDYALEAAALRRAGDIDQLALGEGIGSDDLAHCHASSVCGLDFAQSPRHESAPLAVTPLGSIQPLVETKPELDRAVAVSLRGLDLCHNAGSHFQHRRRVGQTRVIKYLGHPQFLSDKPLDHWLSPVSQEAAQHLGRVRPQSVSSAVGHPTVRPGADATT